MTWFVLALLGSFCIAAFQVAQRLFLKDKGDSRSFTFINTASAAVFLTLLLPGEKIRLSLEPSLILWLIFVALLNGVNDLVFSRSRQLEEASKVAIALQSGHLWFLLGSFLVFSEALVFGKVLGVVLIVLANLLIIWKGQRMVFSKGITLALLGTLLFAVSTFNTKRLVESFSPLFYQTVLFWLESIFIFFFLGTQGWSKVTRELRLQGKGALLVGPLLGLFAFFLAKALEMGGEVSRVFPVLSLAIVWVTASGVVFLGERESLFKKILATLLALLGVYLVRA